MKHGRIEDIIKNGESQTLEFKKNFDQAALETVCAFANASGGVVLIGINDDKKPVKDIKIGPETLQSWINEIKNKTQPQLIIDAEIREYDGSNIVALFVDEYPIKPVALKGRYFKRVRNSNHQLSLSEISDLYLKTMNSSWDFHHDPHHSYNHISEEKILKFIRKVEKHNNSGINMTPYEFMSKMEFIRDGKITIGAYLLFAKDHCVITDIQAGRFKSPTKIIDDITLSTDLFTESEEIIRFIQKNIMLEFIVTGKLEREERYDYPMDAVREIVVNMIVHRDYRESSGSTIKIFDDRIEFYNPGKLFGGITMEDLLTNNYTSQARNKVIAKAFKEIGSVERYGSGIKKVFDICRDYGVISPKFEEKFNGFFVTLYKEKLDVPKDVTKDVTRMSQEMSQEMSSIMQLVKENSAITAEEMAVKLNVTTRTVYRIISVLKKEGLLERVGATKKGRWVIIKRTGKQK